MVRRPTRLIAFLDDVSRVCCHGQFFPTENVDPLIESLRAARIAPLVPLLQKRGFQLLEREAGNFLLPAYPGLIVKDSYWRWPERNLAGNAIDFWVQDLGLSCHDAKRQITGT